MSRPRLQLTREETLIRAPDRLGLAGTLERWNTRALAVVAVRLVRRQRSTVPRGHLGAQANLDGVTRGTRRVVAQPVAWFHSGVHTLLDRRNGPVYTIAGKVRTDLRQLNQGNENYQLGQHCEASSDTDWLTTR